MSAAAIVSALRARAVAASYTVVLFRVVDPEADSLPAVMFAGLEEARQADDEAHGLVHRLLDITVALVDQADDDHVIEVLQMAEDLSSSLVIVEADVPDRLGLGYVSSVEVIDQRVQTRTSSSDVVVVELLIRVAYSE